MLNNMIVSGILTTSLLLTPTNNVAYANSNEVTFNKINNEQLFIMDKNYIDLKEEFKTKQNIINRVNERFDKIEEQHRIEEEKKRKEEEEKLNHRRNFIVTYYGATYNECGNNHFITASGVPVEEGHIAVPRSIPFGSKIILEGNEYIATDTGNPKYICELSDGTLRVDVFIERQYGENDYQYEKRVNNMGAKRIVGELYLKQ